MNENLAENSVKNANYSRVVDAVDDLMKERYAHVCRCKTCRDDITALALNYLPPHYYVDACTQGKIGSPWLMVETAVHEAIEKVAANPRH